MSITQRIDLERRCVFTEVRGEITAEEAVASTRSLGAHPDFDPKLDQLCDLTRVIRIVSPAEEVDGIAAVDRFAPSSRRALVVAEKSTFGFARMYQGLMDGVAGEIRVFESIREAREWLGLD